MADPEAAKAGGVAPDAGEDSHWREQPIAGRQGQYAGGVTRLLAFTADIGASWAIFTLGAAALTFFVELVTGLTFGLANYQIASLAVFVAWEFAYFAVQWTLGGRTIGMAIFGIRVVTAGGARIGSRQAVIRTATLPLSFLVFGLGFLGILTNPRRYAWHDRFAGTAVVYSWDARAARLRWLASR